MLSRVIMLGFLGLVGPAAAQPAVVAPYVAMRDGAEVAQVAAAEAARQRDIVVTNELSRLQAQARTTQALSDLAAVRASMAASAPNPIPPRPGPAPDPRRYAQIPDAALAASNARVRAAAGNRR